MTETRGRPRAPQLTFGPYAFDPQRRVLRRSGEELSLPPRVLGVLEVLLERAGDIVPRQELLDSVWKDAYVTDTSLGEAVSALRQALGDDAQAPRYVQTLHRRGYRFVAQVAPADVERPPASAGASIESPESAGPSIAKALLPWSIAALCAAAAIAAVSQAVSRRTEAARPVARFEIPLPPGTRLDARAGALAVSADGRTIAWSGCEASACRLYVRPLNEIAPRALAGTEGAAAPFFSPDNRWVGFFADGKLKKVPVTGGAAVALGDAPDVRGGVWTARGEIIYAGSAMDGLWVVPANGGQPVRLTTPAEMRGEVSHAWPALTPAGDALLFIVMQAPGAATGSLVASALRSSGRPGEWQTLASGVARAAAPTTDTLVLARGAELQATWYDRRRQSASDAAAVVAGPLGLSATGVQFAVSPAGTLAVARAQSRSGGGLAWIHDGLEEPAGDLDRSLREITLSPDGSRIAGWEGSPGAAADIWIADLKRGTASQRLTHGGANASPIWFGTTIYYAARDAGAFAIWRKDADSASSVPARVHASAGHTLPLAVAPDGSALAFRERGDVFLLPLQGGRPTPLLHTAFEERSLTFSPDGKSIAYISSESGRWEAYVQRLADGRRAVVSRQGAERAHWSFDGKAIYYQSGPAIMRAPVAGDGELLIGTPERVATVADAELVGSDRAGRLLVSRLAEERASLHVVLEWTRELRTLLGPPPPFVPR